MAAAPVFNSIDDVVLPSAAQAGAPCQVLVYGRQRGQRVAKAKTVWRASARAPVIVPRDVQVATAPRRELRPSAIARQQAGAAGAQAMDYVQYVPANVSNWQSEEDLPFELNGKDVGWHPGPVGGCAGRAPVQFTGARPGMRNARLTARSSARTIMREVMLSDRLKKYVEKVTRRHVRAWAKEHPRPDGIEKAFSPARLRPAHLELYLTAGIKIAQLPNLGRLCDIGLWHTRH